MLSVIIPAYNVSKYIEKCIESVISLENIEVIVVNDGSEEDIDFIAKKYISYPNFRYFKKENGGVGDARNYGIKNATREYLMFLDGDDFIDTNKLKKALVKIKKMKKEAYFFKYQEYYSAEEKTIKEMKYTHDNSDYISTKEKNMLDIKFNMIVWRYIIKRRLILENNLFFFKGIYHEDEEWSARLLTSIDKVYNLKEDILFYRQHKNSIMHSMGSKNFMDLFAVIDLLYDYKNSLKNQEQINFINLKIRGLYKTIYSRLNEISLTNSQKNKIIKQLEERKNKIIFGKRFRDLMIKYLPIKLLLLIRY